VLGAVLLGVAITIEVATTVVLPRAQGFTNLPWSAVVVLGYGTSIWLLSLVVRSMPVSVAYAVWSGVGTALVAVLGITLLGESVNPLKVASLALIVAGVVGLNVSGAH
jgi:small multidrug resistance pump